jgi:hypothetical protein
MRSIVSVTVGLLAMLALSLPVSSAGWAEQREARLLGGPMSLPTERPTAVRCSVGQAAACGDAGKDSCKPGNLALYQACLDSAKAACMAACGN